VNTYAISIKGWKSYPTIYHANSYCIAKRGLPKSEYPKRLLGYRPMNIRQGNGAAIVVRTRESLVHGEERQLTFLIQLKENV